MKRLALAAILVAGLVLVIGLQGCKQEAPPTEPGTPPAVTPPETPPATPPATTPAATEEEKAPAEEKPAAEETTK